MIRMMTKQLLTQSQFIPKEVWELSNKRDSAIDMEDVRTILIIMLREFGLVYLCIDALDECDYQVRQQLLKFINSDVLSTICLFSTARNNVELEVIDAVINLQPVTISITADGEDIRTYLEGRIADDPHVMDDRLREEIIDRITSMNHGM
jgi:hypothetical protein